RDIFATSRFLGHSSVNVTEKHYTGLIQSLQVEYHQKFEETLSGQLLFSRYLNPKPNQTSPIEAPAESPHFTMEKAASRRAASKELEPVGTGHSGPPFQPVG
ncbi:MAG: hypothetical protein V3U35_06815, partial [Candidatus Neomarinimicrobiota bacterium]